MFQNASNSARFIRRATWSLLLIMVWEIGLPQGYTAEPQTGHDAVADPLSPVADSNTRKGADFPDVDVLQIRKWLPDDTESVLVSSASLRRNIPAVTRVTPDGKGGTFSLVDGSYLADDFAEAVADISVSALFSEGFMAEELSKRIEEKYFTPASVRSYTMAARNRNVSRVPKCDQLTIVRFRHQLAKKLVAEIEPLATAVSTIRGHRVLEVNIKRRVPQFAPEKPALWTPVFAYITAPDETVLVISSGLDFLNALLWRMGENPQTPALSLDLPEWRYIDRSARAWGIRHYRQESAASDATSMLKWDKGAIGLVVFCEGNPSRSVTMRYISNSVDADKHFSTMAKEYSENSEFMKICRISSIAWEARYLIYPSTMARPQVQAFCDFECKSEIFTLFSPLLGTSDDF